MSDLVWTEQDSINLTASLVAHDGHRMALLGAEREAALRMMAALGLDRATMATRLRLTIGQVNRAASYYRIKLPSMIAPQHWAVAVVEPSKDLKHRRAKKAQRARAVA